MKKLQWLLFLVITLTTMSQEIFVSGVNYPNTPIKLSSDGQEGIWKVESGPIYSNPKLVVNDMGAIFTADVVGEFKLSFTKTDSDEKIIKIIKIERFNQFNEQFDEKQIYDIIVESFKSKNYKLVKYGINTLKVNYPTSNYLNQAYLSALELCKDQALYEEGTEYADILIEKYKYTKEEKISYLTLIYEYYNYFGKYEKELEYLEELAESDDVYKEKLGKYYLSKKVTEDKGLMVLEKLYKKNFSVELASFLGDFYLSRGYEEKAMEYYGNSDKLTLAKLYLKRGEEDSYEELKKILTIEENERLEELMLEKIDYNKMENYYTYAENNIKKDRLELAEIYLNRIVSQESNNDFKKKSAKKLVDLYVIQERYEKAIAVYESYLNENMTLKDVDILYNKGLIYSKLNETKASLAVFNEVMDKYPKTIWAIKANIAIFKMNNQ